MASRVAREKEGVFVIITITLVILLSLARPIAAHGGIDDGDYEPPPPPSNDNSTAVVIDLHSKSLINVKIYCLVILLLSTFIAGVSPYFFRWNESFLLLGTQFAGGVFLGTALMHFLADSTDQFGKLTRISYPFSFMLASAGYLLMMLSDCIIQWVTNKRGGRRTITSVEVEDQEGRVGDYDHHDSVAEKVNPVFAKTTNLGDTILLIVALCFHSVFEGIAIGTQGTVDDTWTSLWTIGLHKIFAAVAMGIALLKMLPKRPLLTTAFSSFAFAISSPIGVGIGIAIDATSEPRTAAWVYAIAMGFATGVFIYVAISHLIAKGFKPEKPSAFDTPFWKFAVVLLGIGIIAVVMIWD